MFDKLIESEPEGADFKNRRSYFMVSSLIVGILFLAAVVFSIFAADFSLGSSSFELVEMIAPPEMAAVEPETPEQHPPADTSPSQSQVPERQIEMSRTDEPTIVPTTTSVIPNTDVSRPPVPFEIGPRNTDPIDPGTSGRDDTATGPDGLSTTPQTTEIVKEPEPPPVVKDPPPVKKIVSGGVVNGNATSLPKPVYPVPARMMNITGRVDVQVLIDESGKVVSANAASGHPLLRNAAEHAARNAKFTPTYLSNVPVKVTGVIVYNFTR